MPMQPVVFGSSFTAIKPGAYNGPDNANAFVNRYKQDLWIDEIRFSIQNNVTSGTNVPTLQGDVIRAQIYYGRHPMTANFVPINLLCRASNPETNASFNTTTPAVFNTSLQWKLPHPLFMPSNAKLDIQIQNQNDFVAAAAASGFTMDGTQQNATVNVHLVGRFAKPGENPEVIDIPYVAKFIGKIFGATTATTAGQEPAVTEQTGPTDLYNPFSIPMQIEHFIYETSVTGSADSPTTLIPCDGTTIQNGTGSYGLDRRYVQMRMTTHDNKAIVRDYTPLGGVFSATDRSWQVNTMLMPQGFYLIDLTEQEPIVTPV